jgi:hypothetical protein
MDDADLRRRIAEAKEAGKAHFTIGPLDGYPMSTSISDLRAITRPLGWDIDKDWSIHCYWLRCMETARAATEAEYRRRRQRDEGLAHALDLNRRDRYEH